MLCVNPEKIPCSSVFTWMYVCIKDIRLIEKCLILKISRSIPPYASMFSILIINDISYNMLYPMEVLHG